MVNALHTKLESFVMNRFCLGLILVLFISIKVDAQLNPPSLICATVVDDVTVQVTWNEADDVPPDAVYNLYRNNNDGGGWEFVGAVPTGDPLEWEDFIATPELGSVSYHIFTGANDIGSPSSDTVSTLFLELTPAIGSLNSVAELQWNSPKADASAGSFEVYRQIDGEPTESLIASLPFNQLTYLDTLYGLCIEPNEDPVDIKYYVNYVEGSCQMSSQSSIDGFQDLLGPTPPQIETVLIDPFTGDAIIYWYPGTEPDLDEYLVQSVIPQPGGNDQFINLQFIPAGGVTEYVYEQASTTAPTNMVVIAFDNCGNDNSFNQIVSTMYTRSDYNSCDQFAEITWSAYEGWEEGVSKYIIHIDDGFSQYQIEVDPDQLEFELEIVPNSEYQVYIEAISNGTQRPSTSNSTFFVTAYPVVPDFAYNSRATTVDERSVLVELIVDEDAQGATYELYRSEAGLSYQLITTLFQPTSNILSYTDTDTDAGNIVYQYKWRVFDGCGQELFETNVSNNIVLRATPDKQDLINTLQWNAYSDWETGVLEYEIYRKLGSETEFSLLTTVNAFGQFQYEDNIEEFLTDEGQFCYMVVAVENENSFELETISESNVSCATQEPLLWVPNTIVINGYNDVFKPVAGFIDFESYEMEIFNKMG